MTRDVIHRAPVHIGRVLLLALLAATAPPYAAHADARQPAKASASATSTTVAAQVRALKALQVRLNSAGAQRKRIRLRDHARASLEARRTGQPLPDTPLRPKSPVLDPLPVRTAQPAASRLAHEASFAAAVPLNVRVNDASTEGPASGQAESAIAALGSRVLVSWNDAEGFAGGSQAPHVRRAKMLLHNQIHRHPPHACGS